MFTLQGHSSGVLCAEGFNEKKFTQVETSGLCLPQHFESHILINDHRHKGTFTSQQRGLYIYVCVCVCACVRVCVFYLINVLYYSVLLNFISSGSLQGIEQALSLCVCLCVCVHIPTQSTSKHAPICR